MMDILEFEELAQEMLEITAKARKASPLGAVSVSDEQIEEDDNILYDKFFQDGVFNDALGLDQD